MCVLLNESTLIAIKEDTNPNIRSACQEEHCPWDATAVAAWKLRAVSHMFLEIGLNRHEYPFYEQQLILDLGIDSSFCDFQLPHLNIPSPASA